MMGLAFSRSSPMSYAVSTGSMKNVYVASHGSLPISVNTTRPMAMTAPVATMGDSQRATREGSGRASRRILTSSVRLWEASYHAGGRESAVGTGARVDERARHQQPDLLGVRLAHGLGIGQASLRHHR